MVYESPLDPDLCLIFTFCHTALLFLTLVTWPLYSLESHEAPPAPPLQGSSLPSHFGGSLFSPWVLVKRRFSAFVPTHLPSQLFLTCLWQFHLCLLHGLPVLSFLLPERACFQGSDSFFIGTLLEQPFLPHSSISNSHPFVGISFPPRCPRGTWAQHVQEETSCFSLFLVILYWLEVSSFTLLPKVGIWEPFFFPAFVSFPFSSP